MKLNAFTAMFDWHFPEHERAEPSPWLVQSFSRSFFDPCFLVEGKTSVKNQRALNFAFSFLEPGECYLEVGTYKGKTLVSALLGNQPFKAYACDNFAEFSDDPEASYDDLMANLKHYGVAERVRFYPSDFRHVLSRQSIPEPIGVYFYDGGHTEEDHYDAIVLAEPLLAKQALVIIDDWNHPPVRAGTKKAIAETTGKWTSLYELPARFNGDLALWWNGLVIYAYHQA